MNNSVRRRRWSLAAIVSALFGLMLLPGSAAADPISYAFNVKIGTNCIQGTAAADATVHVVWKDSHGSRKDRWDVGASSSGDWFYCSAKAGVIVETGDRLTENDGMFSHSFVVPELTLFQNRTDDVYKGRGPAGDMVRLICGLSNGFEPCTQASNLRVNPNGQWGYNPHWDVRGDEQMSLSWKSADGDKVLVSNVSPFVAVTIGRATANGSTRSGSEAQVALLRNDEFTGIARDVGDLHFGLFSSVFRDGHGHRVRVHVGDRIYSDIASDADWVVTDISSHTNASTNKVAGQCGFSTSYMVNVYRNGVPVDFDHWFTNPNGHFDTHLSIQSGDQVLIWCQQPTGDWIRKYFDVA